MGEPFHIACFIATLGAGGAERVLTMLVNGMVQQGFRVTLVTLSEKGRDFYPVDPRVERIGLRALSPSSNWMDAFGKMRKRVAVIRRELKALRPDVALSFVDQTNVLVMLAARGLKIPVVVSERVDPRQYRIAWVYEFLRKRLYPNAAAVVVQSLSIVEWTKGFLDDSRVFVIPNPVSPPGLGNPVETGAEQKPLFPRPFIAAAGRLEYQKGFDLLIEAFSGIREKFPDVSLVIAGEGTLREALTDQVRNAGLDGKVFFPGKMENLFASLQDAEMFVLSSRFEGFPNVLLEAMAHGLPVVSYDCPSGPADIIHNGVDGVLVSKENIEELRAAIERVLENPDLRMRMGLEARGIVERFSRDRILGEWVRLLRSVGSSRRDQV